MREAGGDMHRMLEGYLLKLRSGAPCTKELPLGHAWGKQRQQLSS